MPDGPPPWAGTALHDNTALLSKWKSNEAFRDRVLDELIKDCIHMEVAGLVSGTLAVSKLSILSCSI